MQTRKTHHIHLLGFLILTQGLSIAHVYIPCMVPPMHQEYIWLERLRLCNEFGNE